MRYASDPFGRRRRAPRTGGQGLPTLEDYQTLAQAFQELKNKYEETRQQLAETSRELQIKDEALRRQTTDMKQMESELVWTKAALNSQDPPAAKETVTDEDAAVWRNRFLRLQAEVDNLRKRWDQRFANETTEARHNILRDMLPLADHLEMALKHGAAIDNPEHRDFLRNVEATYRAFLDTLRRYQVEPIVALGEPFNPELHEAVGQIDEEEAEPNTVVQVVQTGYREGDRLLRPARVLINQRDTSQ
jgi:molecular chaperone GrpE